MGDVHRDQRSDGLEELLVAESWATAATADARPGRGSVIEAAAIGAVVLGAVVAGLVVVVVNLGGVRAVVRGFGRVVRGLGGVGRVSGVVRAVDDRVVGAVGRAAVST